jgi:cyclic beta-1,2-glucan synthetase
MLAHRTSPTNIGLYLLSAACARQFGWIGTQDLLSRLEATLATLDTLERHRGHFLNWYDTQTGAPLLPMYVSTVDSGNLSGHLLAVAQACPGARRGPFDGHCSAAAAPGACRTARLAPLAGLVGAAHPAHRGRRCAGPWPTCRKRSAPWPATTWLQQRCEHRAISACWPAARATGLGSRLRLPVPPKRHLLHIGYRVAEQQLDASFYDLLASESRLTSLLAIAKGDVPVRHWAALGRPFFAVGVDAGCAPGRARCSST